MIRWLNSTNTKNIGTLYFIFTMFAGMINTTLIYMGVISPSVQYPQFHVFIMIIPAVAGAFSNYIVSTMADRSNIAFPRLNGISFWLLPSSLILLLLSAFVGVMSLPLSSAQGSSVDLAIFSVHLAGISSMLAAMNFVTTVYLYMMESKVTIYKLSYRIYVTFFLHLFTIVIVSVLMRYFTQGL